VEADGEYGIAAQARARRDHPALVLDERTLTYGELEERIRRVATVLDGYGVGPGDRVGVMVPNSFEWFESVHGAARLGAVAVPVNTHFKAAEAGWILTDSNAAAVVVAADALPSLAEMPDLPKLVVGGGYEEAVGRATPLAGPVSDPELAGEGWPVTMVYTSGTTGRPKGVVPGADDMRRSARGMAGMGRRWDLGPDDVHLLVGPAYHSGPAAWAQMHLSFGATVVILPRWDAEQCLALIERHRITNSHMVPANFVRILDLAPEVRNRYDLSSLRVVVHAAAPCPVPVKRDFMEFIGAEKVFEYFGATEGGGTAITPQEWMERPGSVGRAFPGNEIVIVGEDGDALPPGQVGQIYVRTTSEPFRYHNDSEKTASAFRGQHFSVGDMGYLDDDGYLYLTDRKADMVISGGVNIYPREIEDVLFLHPDVVDCAVYGVPDRDWGEILVAMVQPSRDSALTDDDVVEWCRARLADYKRPRRVTFVDELPRDPNGKIAKHRLRQAASSGAQQGGHP
jgi:long-chain acyl-CoA synthetase